MNFLHRPRHQVQYEYSPDKPLIEYYRNIVLNPDGTIRPLPFDGKRSGMWYFDGQFYFQKSLTRKKQGAMLLAAAK